jgi:hypothetical protein
MSQYPTRGIIVKKHSLATNITDISKHSPRRTPRPYSLNVRTIDGGRGGKKLRAHRDALDRRSGLPVTTDCIFDALSTMPDGAGGGGCCGGSVLEATHVAPDDGPAAQLGAASRAREMLVVMNRMLTRLLT